MPIQTSCPSCFRPLRVPDELIGQSVRCPGCATEWIAKPAESPPAETKPPDSPPPQAEEILTEAYRETAPAGETPAPPSEGIRGVPAESTLPPPPPAPAPSPQDEFEDDDDDDDRYFDRLEGRRRKGLQRDYARQAKSRLMGPGIGLIIAAGGHLLSALYGMANGLMSMALMMSMPRPAGPGPGAAPMYIAGGVYGLGGLALLIVGGITLYGGIEMLRVRKYTLTMTACILALIPCNCCFGLTGIPFGIWGLVVLLDPKIKAAFGRGRTDQPLPPIADAGE
jgi:hypothetical protein